MGWLWVFSEVHGANILRYFATPTSRLVVDNLLPAHVELPHVLDLAVHLSTFMGRGGHTETLRYLATPTCRSYKWLKTFSLIM